MLSSANTTLSLGWFSLGSLLVFAAELGVAMIWSENYFAGAILLHIAILTTVAMVTGWQIQNRKDVRLTALLLICVAFCGPFGALLCLMIAAFYSYYRRSALDFMDWFSSLFPEENAEESEKICDRIHCGLERGKEAEVEPFRDILTYGTVQQKQAVLAKITNHFIPSFAPLLRQALQDMENAVRVQAATSLAHIERNFMQRYLELSKQSSSNPEQVETIREFAKCCENFAYSGIIQASSEEEYYIKTIELYKILIATLPDDIEAHLSLGKLYRQVSNYEKSCEHFDRCLSQEDGKRLDVITEYMETLYQMNEFSRMRALAQYYSGAFSPHVEITTESAAPEDPRYVYRGSCMIASKSMNSTADVCLILEGTYPYVPGGVSTWTHELIRMLDHLKFSIVALVPGDSKAELNFDLPENVIDLQQVRLQEFPAGTENLFNAQIKIMFKQLEQYLIALQTAPKLKDLAKLITALSPYRNDVGSNILLNSSEAWDLMLRMYHMTLPESAFLDYFWSWRALYGNFYSVLLFNLPKARTYHALSTGYAGLVLARARVETGNPCLLTEHGIYTNERRIEIASAEWLNDQKSLDLSIAADGKERGLKDFWIDTFCGYSKLCYEASHRIITLYEGNQIFQRMDGAEEEKLTVIPNGIDYERFAALKRDPEHPPTIALIGRVVPIKDVKTFIKTAGILSHTVLGLQALIIGPTDEDPLYYQECVQMVEHLGLTNAVTFTGKVRVEEYLPRIDVLVLTSISEAQPLVILEAGAAGIPTVATNVGACSEMILGSSREKPALGPGGGISELSNADSTAAEIQKLLLDTVHYKRCSNAIRQRVRRYYNKKDQHKAYAAMYEECRLQKRLRKVS